MIRRNSLSVLSCLFVMVGVSSCSSTGWQQEVGAYTYGDAVSAYGHPDKCERSVDGNKTCYWKITVGKNRIDKDEIVLVFDPDEKLKSGQSIPRYSSK